MSTDGRRFARGFEPPQFNLNAVLHQLEPLDFDRLSHAGLVIKAYYEHYRLDIAAEMPGVRQYIGSFDSGSYEVAAQLFLRDDAVGTVFVVHGYTDHLGLYGPLIRHLLAQGYSVAGFDLPGHGLSSGELASISSFRHYDRALETFTRLCAGRLPEPWHAVGHSTGGAVVMSMLLRDSGHPFQKAVLLAPLVRPSRWVWLRWAHLGLQFFINRMPRDFKLSSHDHRFLDFIANRDPLQTRDLKMEWITAMNSWIGWFLKLPSSAIPVLVVQGEHDETVDWRYNLRVIHNKFPLAEMIRLPSARHHLVGESSEHRERVFAAISQFLEAA